MSSSNRIRAVFMRGGTSKGLIIRKSDLPPDQAEWEPLFLRAMGSPDPYGRQLNGMGGGISSLSKICVVAPSTREDADIDYTFAQISVAKPLVDYSANCGNMSSAVGPYAVDEGLVKARDGEVTVRIYNTNTQKIILSSFLVRGGRAVVEGELEIPGVGGSGAPIRLDFLEPGGASTGALLPTGRPFDVLDVPGVGRIKASLVDAANACVFIDPDVVGIEGTEMPEEIDGDEKLLARLAAIRHAASIAMGISSSLEEAQRKTTVPFIGFARKPANTTSLAGMHIAEEDVDLVVRMLSNGKAHRALPLTASLCTAVAAQIEGTIVNSARRGGYSAEVRLGTPSGVLKVGAHVTHQAGTWRAERGSFYRTARRLFEGHVYA